MRHDEKLYYLSELLTYYMVLLMHYEAHGQRWEYLCTYLRFLDVAERFHKELDVAQKYPTVYPWQ